MELYVIRHGQSETNVDRRFGGWAQVPLTEKGMNQARSTHEKLKGIKFDRIISSDLLRAKQTTELVFPGCVYSEDRRLREINVGAVLEKKCRIASLEEYGEPLRKAMENRDYRAFDGESTEDQIRRVAEFMDDLAAIPDDERIAVVCHEGSLFSVLCYVLGVQLKYCQTEAGNASYSRFKRQNGVWKLVSWNEGSM